MGTSATVRVYDDARCLLTLLTTSDGFPGSAGKEIASFILSAPIVNGLSSGREFNGAGCFAAQLVAHLKTDPGTWYVVSSAQRGEYDYKIVIKDENAFLTCKGVGSRPFKGTPAEFLTWLASND